MKVYFNPRTSLQTKKNASASQEISPGLKSNILLTFSGRSAIALYLERQRAKKILENKTAQFLVPEWLCTSMVVTMHQYCFPTTHLNEKVRGILLYHQWGFPQKIDEILSALKEMNVVVIEDCAHSFMSFYKGKRVGTFSDSIWSFPKFFPSVAGGALYTTDSELMREAKRSRFDLALEKKVFANLVQTEKKPTKNNLREQTRNSALYHELRKAPPVALKKVAADLQSGAIEKRKANFDILRKRFWGTREDQLVKECEVLPWVVPLFFDSKNGTVAAALRRLGVECGVYHFDVNRNMLEPDFKECVPIPCHQGISQKQMESIIDAIVSVV